MKKQTIKELIAKEDWPKAFSTARKFFFGLTEAEKREIEIAADYFSGKSSFYKSLGIDCEKAIVNAKAILTAKFAQKTEIVQ